MSRDGRSLLYRVGSKFENGYDDGDWNVKLIYWVVMTFLFIVSGGLMLIGFVPWYVWRLKNKVGNQNSKPATDET